VQTELPSKLYVPAAHMVQGWPFMLAYPEGQEVQIEANWPDVFPFEQLAHLFALVAIVPSLYVPATQAIQFEAPLYE